LRFQFGTTKNGGKGDNREITNCDFTENGLYEVTNCDIKDGYDGRRRFV
jgi:hypothetical protein